MPAVADVRDAENVPVIRAATMVEPIPVLEALSLGRLVDGLVGEPDRARQPVGGAKTFLPIFPHDPSRGFRRACRQCSSVDVHSQLTGYLSGGLTAHPIAKYKDSGKDQRQNGLRCSRGPSRCPSAPRPPICTNLREPGSGSGPAFGWFAAPRAVAKLSCYDWFHCRRTASRTSGIAAAIPRPFRCRARYRLSASFSSPRSIMRTTSGGGSRLYTVGEARRLVSNLIHQRGHALRSKGFCPVSNS